MYLSRVEVPWGNAKNQYNLHRAIWNLFPGIERELRTTAEETRQGFLFRVEQNNPGHPAIVMVQSCREPRKDVERPLVIVSKEFNPQPFKGQRLAFILSANPIKTIKDEKERLNKKGEIKKCRVPLIKEEQQILWLRERLKNIAVPEAINVRKLAPIFFYKQKEKRDGKIVPIFFEGILCVEHPYNFRKVLENGIGPAKAFGCGLMLARRI